MWVQIFENIILGVSLAAPLGPVSIEMIRRGLLFGFWPAFSVRLGAAVDNLLCLVIGIFGAHLILGKPHIQLGIWIFGVVLLLYMGVSSIRSGIKGSHHFKQSNASPKGGFVRGFILSLTSPIGLLWWLTVFPSISAAKEASALSFVIILGVLLWGVVLSLIASMCGRFVRSNSFRWIEIGSGCLLIGFALQFALKAFLYLQ